MQAVIKIGSTQHLVTPGQEILVEKQTPAEGEIIFDQVLMLIDGEKVQIGQPTLTGVQVKAQITGQEKGEKIRVFKYKAKSRYSKTRGFRAKLSRIKIEDIILAQKALSAEKPVKKVSTRRVKKA